MDGLEHEFDVGRGSKGIGAPENESVGDGSGLEVGAARTALPAGSEN